MFAKKFFATVAIIALTSSAAFAQATAPAKPATAAPAAPAAVTAPAKPVVTAPAPVAAPAAVAKKMNLNTATAEEMDKLPQIGPARAKAIVEARTKTKFKDWADFTARNVVPSNAEAAIKDLVSF